MREDQATPLPLVEDPQIQLTECPGGSVRGGDAVQVPSLTVLFEALLTASLLPSCYRRSDFPLSGYCFRLQSP